MPVAVTACCALLAFSALSVSVTDSLFGPAAVVAVGENWMGSTHDAPTASSSELVQSEALAAETKSAG